MSETVCWVCGQLATWRVIGERENPPVLIEFHSCEKHVPFSIVEKKEQTAHA